MGEPWYVPRPLYFEQLLKFKLKFNLDIENKYTLDADFCLYLSFYITLGKILAHEITYETRLLWLIW